MKGLRDLMYPSFSYRSRVDDGKEDVERGSLSRDGSRGDITYALFYLISSMRKLCIARD